MELLEYIVEEDAGLLLAFRVLYTSLGSCMEQFQRRARRRDIESNSTRTSALQLQSWSEVEND